VRAHLRVTVKRVLLPPGLAGEGDPDGHGTGRVALGRMGVMRIMPVAYALDVGLMTARLQQLPDARL
jgi:hypothetical protein